MSELFFNRGKDDRLSGIIPRIPNAHLYGPVDNPTVFKRDDGMYSRQEIDAAFLARIDETMTTAPETLTIQDWRLWLQHAWKTEHGTVAAAERFGTKLVEEYDEFGKAQLAHLFNTTEHTRDDAVSEAGDVLWCLGAAVTNAGVSLETILQTRMLSTALGTVVVDGPESKYPVWRPKLLELATSTLEPMTIGQLDELFAQGYEPYMSPAMNIDEDFNDPEREYEALDHWQFDQLLSVIFKNNIEHQFGEYLEDTTRYKQAIEEIAPYLILRTMYTVRVIADATLAETVAKNYKKISSRIDAGLIDHADGERSEDLL